MNNTVFIYIQNIAGNTHCKRDKRKKKRLKLNTLPNYTF